MLWYPWIHTIIKVIVNISSICFFLGNNTDYLFADGKKNDDRGTKFEDVLRDLEDVYSYKDDTYDYSTYKLFITGHSLGGALASLLTVALAGHEFAKTRPAILPVTCISYASPRAGCYSFKLLHKVNIYRTYLKLWSVSKLITHWLT